MDVCLKISCIGTKIILAMCHQISILWYPVKFDALTLFNHLIKGFIRTVMFWIQLSHHCIFSSSAAELLGVIPEDLAAALISNVNYLRGMYCKTWNFRDMKIPWICHFGQFWHLILYILWRARPTLYLLNSHIASVHLCVKWKLVQLTGSVQYPSVTHKRVR